MEDTISRAINVPTRPARPFDVDGVLLTASEVPLLPQQVQAACLGRVAAHLAHTCNWPEAGRGSDWQPGDYSFYVLQFQPGPGAALFVQFWSEPDEPVLVEVSSGEWNKPTLPYVTEAMRERLLFHDFTVSGEAKNFQKRLPQPLNLAAMAADALAVLTDCLGYDGRMPLSFQVYLGRKTSEVKPPATRLLDKLSHQQLAQLLTDCGAMLPSDLKLGARHVPATIGGVPFLATLLGERDDESGLYEGFVLRAWTDSAGADAADIAARLALKLPFAQVGIDKDGDLSLAQNVAVEGGVTRDHLIVQLGFWKENLKHWIGAIVAQQRSSDAVIH